MPEEETKGFFVIWSRRIQPVPEREMRLRQDWQEDGMRKRFTETALS